MGKLIFVLVVLFCSINVLKAETFETFNCDVQDPSKIHFINENTGFLCGSGGIYITYNAGENWYLSYGYANTYDTTSAINDFVFLENGIVYAVGWKGTPISDTVWTFSNLIIKSTNNGENWTEIMSESIGKYSLKEWKQKSLKGADTKILFSVCAISPSLVVAAGNYASVFITTNGGANWQEGVTGWNAISVMVYHNNIIYGGEYNKVFTSTNNGINWLATISDPSIFFISTMTLNNNKLFVGGSSGSFMSYGYTTNNGVNWSNKVLSDSGSFYDFLFLNDSLGYASASNKMIFGVWNTPKGYILKTVDGGLNWKIILEEGWHEIIASCKTQQYLFFAGSGGVLKRMLLPTTSVINSNNISSSFKLNQNYPNPFNPTTKITYTLKNKVDVKIVVYNLIGKEMKTLVDENQTSGSHEITFNAADLPSGPYFYKLTAGNFTSVRKMMLIK